MLDDSDSSERRAALIAKELESLTIDITAVQETRRETQGQVEEKDYSFYWIGKNESCRNAGVAFAFKTELANKLPAMPKSLTERLMTLRIPIKMQKQVNKTN